MALTRVAPAGIGSTPGTGYVIGDSFLHSRGLNATDGYYTGIVTTQSLRVIGDLEVEGTTTTLDTALTEVDKLEVGANNNTVGVAITQSGSGYVATFEGGNFGIGNNTPDAPLRVTSSAVSEASQANDIAVFERNDNGYLKVYTPNDKKGGIVFGDPDSPFVGATLYDHSTNKLEFWTGSGPRMYVDSSGNVGIGTDDPSWGVSTGLIVGDGASARGVTIFSNSANVGDLAFADATSGTARYRGLIRYDHSDDSLALRTNSSERLRITSSGNVGIGSDIPQTKLDIQGGEVYYHSGTNNNLGVKLTYSNGNSTGVVDTYGNHELEIRTNNSERARFTSNGLKFPSGKGIDFSATSDGTGANQSELLDDYEEGTWTPKFVNITNGNDYFVNNGLTIYHANYVKIGEHCWASAYIANDASFSYATGIDGSQHIGIGGLPFTVIGSNGGFYPISVGYFASWTGWGASYTPMGYFYSGFDRVVLTYATTNTITNIQGSVMLNGGSGLLFSGYYKVA